MIALFGSNEGYGKKVPESVAQRRGKLACIAQLHTLGRYLEVQSR